MKNKKYSERQEIETFVKQELPKYRKVYQILQILSQHKITEKSEIDRIGSGDYQDLLSSLEKIGAIRMYETFQKEYVPTNEIWYLDESEMDGSKQFSTILKWITENPHKSYSVEGLGRKFNIYRPFGKSIINVKEEEIERVLSTLENKGYLKIGNIRKVTLIESNTKLIKLILELFEEENEKFLEEKSLVIEKTKSQLDPDKKEQLLKTIKKELEENVAVEKIAEELTHVFNLRYNWVICLVNGVKKLLNNPEKGINELFDGGEKHTFYKLGIRPNEVRENLGLKILYKKCGDQENLYKILKTRPTTTEEIKKLKKGKTNVASLIFNLKRSRNLDIKSLTVPFTNKEVVYYLPQYEMEAIKIARKMSFEKYKSFLDRLKEKEYKVDEKVEKVIKQILLKKQISEDDNSIRKLKNYKGIFNYLLKSKILKVIVENGKTYYSFWDLKKN
ncbi:MAG: hypothetical protein QXR09_00585 [Candidatus Aenigmatarchaeota archaeon]